MTASRHHYVMGTVVSFAISTAAVPGERIDEAVADACDELDRLDAIFSTWRDDSPLSKLRRGELDLDDAPPEVSEVLRLCSEAKALTGGLFDPWALPGGVDPTGLVKGWAIERALSFIEDSGARGALVNGGGDISTFGVPDGESETGSPRTWRVGIQHPWRTDALACVVELAPGESLATSGRYQRGEHLIVPEAASHLADPNLVASASVSGPSLALADALATALCIAGPGGLSIVDHLDGYEAYRILADGSEESTAGFPLTAAA